MASIQAVDFMGGAQVKRRTILKHNANCLCPGERDLSPFGSQVTTLFDN